MTTKKLETSPSQFLVDLLEENSSNKRDHYQSKRITKIITQIRVIVQTYRVDTAHLKDKLIEYCTKIEDERATAAIELLLEDLQNDDPESKTHKFRDITELDLGGLLLKTIPSSIQRLQHLITLNVFDNQLSDLPDELVQLPQLRELNLNGNNFRELPAVLFKLDNLNSLFMLWNKLKKLPTDLQLLHQLEDLRLGYNQIKKLPDSLTTLSHLKRLDLNHNEIPRLPVEIGTLQHLEYLDIRHNPISNLRSSCVKWQQLTHIFCSKTRFRKIPTELYSCVNLKVLHIDACKINKISRDLGTLTSLVTLNLADNNITELPEIFDSLPHLQYLYLQRNQLQTLPKTLNQLTNLQELYVHDNQLQQIPTGIFSKIHQLQRITLKNNQLSYLPKDLQVNGSSLNGRQQFKILFGLDYWSRFAGVYELGDMSGSIHLLNQGWHDYTKTGDINLLPEMASKEDFADYTIHDTTITAIQLYKYPLSENEQPNDSPYKTVLALECEHDTHYYTKRSLEKIAASEQKTLGEFLLTVALRNQYILWNGRYLYVGDAIDREIVSTLTPEETYPVPAHPSRHDITQLDAVLSKYPSYLAPLSRSEQVATIESKLDGKKYNQAIIEQPERKSLDISTLEELEQRFQARFGKFTITSDLYYYTAMSPNFYEYRYSLFYGLKTGTYWYMLKPEKPEKHSTYYTLPIPFERGVYQDDKVRLIKRTDESYVLDFMRGEVGKKSKAKNELIPPGLPFNEYKGKILVAGEIEAGGYLRVKNPLVFQTHLSWYTLTNAKKTRYGNWLHVPMLGELEPGRTYYDMILDPYVHDAVPRSKKEMQLVWSYIHWKKTNEWWIPVLGYNKVVYQNKEKQIVRKHPKDLILKTKTEQVRDSDIKRIRYIIKLLLREFYVIQQLKKLIPDNKLIPNLNELVPTCQSFFIRQEYGEVIVLPEVRQFIRNFYRCRSSIQRELEGSYRMRQYKIPTPPFVAFKEYIKDKYPQYLQFYQELLELGDFTYKKEKPRTFDLYHGIQLAQRADQSFFIYDFSTFVFKDEHLERDIETQATLQTLKAVSCGNYNRVDDLW